MQTGSSYRNGPIRPSAAACSGTGYLADCAKRAVEFPIPRDSSLDGPAVQSRAPAKPPDATRASVSPVSSVGDADRSSDPTGCAKSPVCPCAKTLRKCGRQSDFPENQRLCQEAQSVVLQGLAMFRRADYLIIEVDDALEVAEQTKV